ncbi:protein of unknown function [Niabella drilacis]|uniref:DUF4185 domain-containing protein n=1 Tax=Niabella drilacis (strain DSM 25811 / CCM 8410 / CCUG 62505 / LMG 26954 / E90) TaxID=1285928 RepID=A0A1G6JM64_NIADE|nr:protein of unknown function [Niabella drilacis]
MRLFWIFIFICLYSCIPVREQQRFFAAAAVEPVGTDTQSDGDLWPAAWSDDDQLYAANGDGKGFDLNGEWDDIVVNRVSGMIADNSLSGVRLASGNQVADLFLDTAQYNRKPTGMISVKGILYLAVQHLNKKGKRTFNEVPVASIYASADKGRTWKGPDQPMFIDYVFTTIMFLDYGKDNRDNVFDHYVYAYGLDSNWRDSYNDIVPDPQRLYLARVPADKILDRSAWEFFSGTRGRYVQWSPDISDKKPVLEDLRRRYPANSGQPGLSKDFSVISQGSVVYNKPLQRYIYTSWTEFTFEFYEAPSPWGPWKLFFSYDFGPYPWTEKQYGGYAVVAPSKFISEDGQMMGLVSSTFSGGVKHYNFAYRKLWLVPYVKNLKTRADRSDSNIAANRPPDIVTPLLGGSLRRGHLSFLNDAGLEQEAGLNRLLPEKGQEYYWGYSFSRPYCMNELVYYSGTADTAVKATTDGVRVQVRKNFRWKNVKTKIKRISYQNEHSSSRNKYIITFKRISGDGIRIVGKPGKSSLLATIRELAVFNR